ncbi:MAG: hypothetical protein ACO3EZ_15395 [Prochlorotrichaceae cyanobacterium]
MSEILDSELNSMFVAPEREFKGEPLAKYTEGSRLLLLQTKTDESNPTFFIWAFIYLHIQLKKNRKEIIRLCWDCDAFRDKVLSWIDGMTKADSNEAINLVATILDEASAGSVEAVKTGKEAPLGNS